MIENVSDVYLKKPGPFNLNEKWEMQRIMFEAGMIPALYDALALARDSGYPLPDWALLGAIKIVGDRLKFPLKTGKGQAGNEWKVYYNAMVKFRRWQAVQNFLDKGGTTKEQAVEKAMNKLASTPYKASFDTISDCYDQVRKDLKDPEAAKKYYPAMWEAQWLTDTAVV